MSDPQNFDPTRAVPAVGNQAFDPSRAVPVSSTPPGFDPSRAVAAPSSPTIMDEAKRFGSDMAGSFAKGAVAVPEAAVGLADIPTGGAIGKLLEEKGFTPKAWKQQIQAKQSPELQQQLAEVQNTEGFIPTIKAMVKNPATIADAALQSVPGSIAGGMIGRVAAGAGASLPMAAGIGEGAVTAGQQVEQIREDTPGGVITPKQAALGAASGVITGAIGANAAALANKLGIREFNQMLIGGQQVPVEKGMLGRTVMGALTEGALEELPQSAQEQALQNIAEGDPWDKGVANAAVQGMMAGAAMGAGANIPGPLTSAAAKAHAMEEYKAMPFKNAEAAQMRANAMSNDTGTPYEVVPHPSVQGAYAVQPVAEAQDGSGTGSGDRAGDGAVPAAAAPDVEAGVQERDAAGGEAAAAGTGAGDGQRAAAVEQGPAEPGAPGEDRAADGAAGAGHEDSAGPVGPLTAAAAVADPESSLAHQANVAEQAQSAEQTEEPAKQTEQPIEQAAASDPNGSPFTNLGADKITGPLDLRMDSPVDIAAHEATNSPFNERPLSTEPQQDANNAKLGHVDFQGLDLRIENPQGSVRSSRADDPVQWKTLMTDHYGYIASTKGADGAGVDVFVGPHVDSGKAFVVDQAVNGQFDEHKVMLGYQSLEQAKQAYYDNYQQGWQGGEAIHETTVDGLKDWLKNGDTTKPFMAGSQTGAGAAVQSAPNGATVQPGGAARPLPSGLAPVQSPTGSSREAASSTLPAAQSGLPAAANAAQQGALANRLSGEVANDSSVSPDKDGSAKDTAKTAGNGSEISPISTQTRQAVADKVLPQAESPSLPESFKSPEEAQKFAADNQLDASVAPSPAGKGYALYPRAVNQTALEQRNEDAGISRLNADLAPNGVKVEAVHDVTPYQRVVQAVAKAAFGARVTYVSDNPIFDGVAQDGRVFISDKAEGGSLIHVAFHELGHVMQQTNRPLAARLEKFVMSYVNGGVVEARAAFEQKAAEQVGMDGKLSEQGKRDEVMADIHGALALDHKFWKAMAEHDPNLFRKVAYKFMELLTHAVEVAKGSRYDISQMVSDVDKVRDAVARGWAEYNAERSTNDKEVANGFKLQRKDQGAGRQQADSAAERDTGGLRGKDGVLDVASRKGISYGPLRNLPTSVTVDGRTVTFGPYRPAREAAAKYMQQAGLAYNQQREYVKLDKTRATNIANEFAAMKNDPSNPKVKASYDAMIRETLAQYQAIKDTGLKVEFIDLEKTGDPYGNPRNAILDVVNNNHLWVFSTRDGFGGPNATLDVSGNPLLAETGEKISGQTALANDIFRIVHDYFGHIKEGIGFRAEGEENAWQQHVRMYSEDAIPAMTSETRGQNSWVNFGPYSEFNKTASGADTEYAPQKIGLMPDWTYNQGRGFSRKEGTNETQPAESVNRPGDDSVRGTALRPQKPDALPVVNVTHYGTAGSLGQLDASKYGSGIRGAEAARLSDAPADIKNRVYFYLTPEDGSLPKKEGGLGPHVYQTALSNMYDLSKDPAHIFDQIKGIKDQAERNNALEMAIVKAGYDGYVAKAMNMAVVLGQNVPVEYKGTDRKFSRSFDDKFWKWFGESTVANNNGEPKVMYHGTARDFEQFNPKQADAIFVTDQPGFAHDFAGSSQVWAATHADETMTPEQLAKTKSDALADMKQKIKADWGYSTKDDTYKAAVEAIQGDGWKHSSFDEERSTARNIAREYMQLAAQRNAQVGQNIMPVYVKAENPFDPKYEPHVKAVSNLMADSRDIEPGPSRDRFLKGMHDELMYGDNWDQVERWDVQQAIKAMGHDSFYVHENGIRNLAVYNPAQLKSATGNNGDYNIDDARLNYARKPPEWIHGVAGMTPELAEKAGIWVPGKSPRERWNEMRTNIGERFIQSVVDQYAPIKKLDLHSYILARMSKSVDGAVEAMLDYGKVGIDGDGALTVDMNGGFKHVLAQLQGEQDRFFAWVAGQRSAMLKAQGRENLFTDSDITTLKSLNQGKMGDGASRALLYAKANSEMQAFNRSVLDVAEKTGVINPEARQIWEQQHYVPFYRLSDGDETFTPTNVSGLANAKGIVKLKGGTNNLGDLLQNTVMNWNYLLSASLKNQAALLTLRNAQLVGAATEIGSPMKGSIFALDGGKQVHFMVTDPYLATAVGSISFTGIRGPIMDAASAMKRALSFGVTFSPSYRIRNLIRDQLQAVAVNPMSFNIASNLVNGLKLSNRDTPLYAQMLAAGGLIRMGSSYENDRAAVLKRHIDKLDPTTVLDSPSKIKNALEHMYDAYMETGERAEAATRMVIGQKALADGASALQAAYLMRDSMDFSLSGSSTAVRVLTQVVPFFNARLQGFYKLGRGAMEDKARFATVLGAMTAATVGLMLANAGDPDWEKREEWDRNNYWWFKVGGLAYRIPKPFEMGAMATFIERGTEMAMAGMGKTARERFAKQIVNILSDNLSMNPIPQIVKPAIEAYANTDTFRNRPIESPYEQNLSKNERFGPGTTAISRLGARGINAVTSAIPGGGDAISPKQLDYLISGYFGWIGAHLALASDYLLRPAMGLPERADRKIDNMFFVGDWVKEVPSNQSRFVTEFYNQAHQLQQTVADINNYKKLGNVDKVKDLIAGNKDILQNKSAYTSASQTLARINTRLKQIDAATNMTADEKRQETDRLSTLRNNIAERVYERTVNK